jgi:hypothetical protein
MFSFFNVAAIDDQNPLAARLDNRCAMTTLMRPFNTTSMAR